MKKAWIIVAIVLTALGAAIFTGALFASGFDFSRIPGGNQMTEKSWTISEDFQDIDVHVRISDVEFKASEDDVSRVVARESEKVHHEVTVYNDTLKIESVEENWKWFDLRSLFRMTPSVTVYLPKENYNKLFVSSTTGDIRVPGGFGFDEVKAEASTGDVSVSGAILTVLTVKTTTGDITVKDFATSNMELSASTGKITVQSGTAGYDANPLLSVIQGKVTVRVNTGALHMEDFSCGTLETSGNTGSIRMKNVLTRGDMTLERSTGSIHFESCDAEAGKIQIKTSTGSVRGSFKTGKRFIAQSSTGSVHVPDTDGIRCEIRTSTGSIDVTVE
ncbi:MAG: DUF4097 family beta strand repeat protein [Lachnospiraceae bacterium]|nr:DUF4097 family beta strand repeat protein [Lachnospiraceae bacterium]